MTNMAEAFPMYSLTRRGLTPQRSRFALEVIDAVTEVWGPGRVGIKLSPAAGVGDLGMPLEEQIAQFKHLIAEIDARKIAYILLVQYLRNFRRSKHR
jgi:2,4-dienoyl-CoA reductase-like NADH-dependent reductase (Old Yellow Enzyme family)